MFTGTPCQVAGLRKYLRKNYENLLLVDIVCHGVPSPMVWKKYLLEEKWRSSINNRTKRYAESKIILEKINFRDKSTGWKCYSVLLDFVHISSREQRKVSKLSVFPENVYMKAFLSNLSIRPSCYNCKLKAGNSGADITMGDFWGIDKILPNLDDNKGVSLMIVYNKKAEEWLRDLKGEFVEVALDKAISCNPSYVIAARKPINRDFFFYLLRKMELINVIQFIESRTLYKRLRRIIYRYIGI